MKRAIAVLMTLALMAVSVGSVMAQSAPAQAPAEPQEDCDYYEETGHNLCGVFQEYWNANGGLPVFGYPITEAFEEENWDTGETYLVQYFERERMEHHTALAGTEYEVLLGRLGNEVLLKQGRDWLTFEKSDPSEANYMDATGFAIAPEFIGYWSSHGLDFGDEGYSFRESLALFGYPISQAEMETNADGDTVLTQWFERARFEFHPDNDAEHQVLLGRLGAEILGTDEPPVERPVGAQAFADLVTAEGVAVGSAMFEETAEGVQITVEVSDFEPGVHGIHIHTVGLCEGPDFTSAGGHFNPYGAEHGFDNPNGPHAGDLPNLEVGEDGTGSLEYVNPLITLGEGTGSLFDEDGSALMIHAGEDDHHSDPAGDSGARIACGVIIAGERPVEDPGATLTVVAENLVQPRHISVGADGALYVAEAGMDGDECVTVGEGDEAFEVCVGLTGSITRIADGTAEQVATGLPSGNGSGPHDVIVTESGETYVLFGLGGPPEARGMFESEAAALLGTLAKVEEDGTLTVIADLAAYEGTDNPEPTAIDSNPYAMVMDGENFIVVDAGGNSLLQVTLEGEITTLATFEAQMVAAPPFLELPEGTEMPQEAVPTDVAIGPDGAYYVAELTGFPFTADTARVWRVTPEGEVELFADGFSAIGAIDFDSEGNLYVLEIAAGGLLEAEMAGPENPEAAASAVTKIAPDGTTEVYLAEGIYFATGLAIDADDNVYIVNFGVMPNAQVVLVEWDAATE